MAINSAQRATGGGPCDAPNLTPIKSSIASIIGLDVGPLLDVMQNQFHEGDNLIRAVQRGTSENLLSALQHKGIIMCTGTLIKTRVPRSARILEDRGKLLLTKQKKIVLTKWVGSKPITFLSSVHSDKTVDSCEKSSKRKKVDTKKCDGIPANDAAPRPAALNSSAPDFEFQQMTFDCPITEEDIRTVATDNWYSSLELAYELLKKETHLIGTLRKNRRGLPKTVTGKKLKPREFVAQQNEDGITVLKWKDKRDVLMLSTKHDDKFVRMQIKGKTIVKQKKPAKSVSDTPTNRVSQSMYKYQVFQHYKLNFVAGLLAAVR
ncbi:transposase IS4 domain-containing protein [Phthorimaea operculella]|nr:transposase IS4 domain-containing protein [Phthorimaea operculella]